MNSEFDIKIKNLNKAAGRRHVFRNIVALLCCAVFLFTGYSLAFKGITLASSDEDVINENETETQYLILQCQCKAEDVVYHEHNEFCYDRDGNLVCELEENIYEPPVTAEETESIPPEEAPVNDREAGSTPDENPEANIINNSDEQNSGNNEEKDINKENTPELTQEELDALTHNHSESCCISDKFETKQEFDNSEVSLFFDTGILPVMQDQKINKKIKPLEKEVIIEKAEEKEEDFNYFYAFDIALFNNGLEIKPNEKFDIEIKINEEFKEEIKEVTVFSVFKDGKLEKEKVIMPDDNVFHFVTSEFGCFGILIKTENNFESAFNLIKSATRGGGIQGDFENGYTNVPETSFLYALIDDSTNIGVPYEEDPYIANDASYGNTEMTFPDSVYTYEQDFSGSGYINIDAVDSAQKTGGIIWGFSNAALVKKNYISEQLWDGNAPFRISGKKAEAPVLHFNYNELQLEDGTHLTNWGKVDTYINGLHINTAPVKFDNWYFEHHNIGSDHNYFYARGNKFVIGENITQQDPVTAEELPNGMYATQETNGFVWGIFGGSENSSHSTSCRTNVVVASGGWSFVYGGGNSGASCYQDTNIAIRGGIVNEVYGGSNNASVGAGGKNTIINIYDGIVGQVFGGNEVDSATGVFVHGNTEVNVSGGHVNVVKLGSDLFTPYRRYLDGTNVNDNKNILNSSASKGSATLNITGTGHVKNVYGDDFRNLSFGDPGSNYVGGYRRIKGPTTLNVSASNEFNEMEYFDVVNIAGENVVVRTENTTGDGYIGSITVKDGATLYLDNGGVINIPYDTSYENYLDKNLIEVDTGNTIYTLHHSWNGEEEEANRAGSRLLIDGQGVINKASPSVFNTNTNTAGLRVYGYVEGYSVLDVNDEPIYSTDTDYYYYVVANASNVGAAAFQEPAGADYIVCFRHFKDENNNDLVGWYLREKPEISIENKFIRAGANTSSSPFSMHIEMNGLKYEWSDIPGSNHVEFGWSSLTGTSDATTNNSPFTLSQITDITEGTNSTYSAVFDNGMLSSVDLVIDNSSEASEPVYAEGYINYRYIDTNFTGLNYTDHIGTTDGIRAVYDFAGNDEYHPDDGYEDSIMVTSPFSSFAKGADTALLRIYLPENIYATLSVSENDDKFNMNNSANPVNLVNSNSITTNFTEENPDIFNNNFGINISNGELAGGYTQENISGITKLPCSVFSYRNIDIRDISENSTDGLNLTLSLSDIKYIDKPVAAQNIPAAISGGELQIQTVPYITRITIEKETTGITDEESSFTVIVRDADNNIITPPSGANYSVDSYGNISFVLSDGENVTIPGIPVGSTLTITQNDVPAGVVVIYKEGNTEISTQTTCTQTINETKTITVLNMPATTLPSTGGNTEIFFIISGLLIIFTVLIFFFVFRRKIYIQNKSKKGVLS